MWVFTQGGFYSVVSYDPSRDHSSIGDEAQAESLLVRGRVRDDLENLRRWIPNIDIHEHPGADYRFRAVVSREQWRAALEGEVDRLDYRNFKDRVSQRQGAERHRAYLQVWTAIRGLQGG